MNTTDSGLITAIDAMVLVWGIRQDGTTEEVKRAAWLFNTLERDNAQIILPATALSEYLIPYGPSEHADIIAQLSRRFFLAPFDAKCAAMAARLFSRGKAGRPMGQKNSRNLLKSDAYIVATAAVHGARRFYSNDKWCRKLAEKAGLTAKDLPDIAPDLFSQ